MTTPLVSVLTTVHNREKYLGQCIESVLASSFSDFEYIIVDDCSTDRSYEIAHDYSKLDSRIRLHRNEETLGDYPNRNRAAELARGNYLKYLDSDDYIYPHGLGVMAEMIEKFPSAALAMTSPTGDAARPCPVLLTPQQAYHRHYFEIPLFDTSPLSTIIRKDSFKVVGGFSGRRLVGDFELWHVLAARYPVVLIPGGLAWYRRHVHQEMEDARKDASVSFAYSIVAVERLSSSECPLTATERSIALRAIRRRQVRAILRLISNGKLSRAFGMLKNAIAAYTKRKGQ
jgi:glycosyltransferase involved in cell wall biosynthesis